MLSQEMHEERTPAEYVEETGRRRQKEALSFIVDSGRATSPEEAERYLDSINRIKEVLIQFSREQMLKQSPNVGVTEPAIEFGGKDLTPSDLDEILPENI